MAIYDLLNSSLLGSAFNSKGNRLEKVYDLNGHLIWVYNNNEANGDTEDIPNGLSASSHWKFHKVSDTTNTSYSSVAESKVDYVDRDWDTVTVPHDWSIRNPFNSKSASTYEGGYLDGGDAWYRVKFTLPDDLKTHRIILYFDGVYMESTVYLNGEELGKNYHGYNPFWFDVTDKLNSAGTNVLAVFVRNRQPSSRWYSGSGIYRPVYLLSLDKQDFSTSEIVVSYPNLETEKDSKVLTTVTGKIHNYGSAGEKSVTLTIRKDGADIASSSNTISLATGENPLNLSVAVPTPLLWGIGTPNLYEAVISVDNTEVSSTTFGYRWTKWDVDTGFWLNGANAKLKGVCMHHDLGCIGAEVNRSAMERQIDSMINMGANAIRLTHNPSSTVFLDLCMKKGVLLVEELFDYWTVAKSTYDFARYYTDHYKEVVRNTILRDRNNPAIIMWSLGNEINRTANYTVDQVTPIITDLIATVKKYDTTRPTTMGEDVPSKDNAKACMNLLDVCGVNYNKDNLAIPHGLGKPSYGSETTSALSSRGVYARDDANLQCSSYDNDVVSWGSLASAAVKAHMTNPYSCGMFVWTGWDYIGEPTPFNKYPAKSSYFGIVDLAGFPKDVYYMYQSRWSTNPMIHILPMDWDIWTENSTVKVWLYSNCDSVELFQDDVSLGKKTQADIGDKYQFEYAVTFKRGKLTAKGYDSSGSVVANDVVVSSTGVPKKLKLSAYKPKVNIATDDLAFITCDICDENGVVIPTANTTVKFSCTGGTILGTDNGNAACVELMRTDTKSAFNGKVLCVCRHDGTAGRLVISATSDGLESGKVLVTKE